MAQIGNVKEIHEVKNVLMEMTEEGLLQCWELPYENILTRREAAIFFLTPQTDYALRALSDRLKCYEYSHIEENTSKAMSNMSHRLIFTQEA